MAVDTLFICTADDPWTLDKVWRGQNLVIPSRHPDAVPGPKTENGHTVYQCPNCGSTFTDPTWLGLADDALVAAGMKVVNRLLDERQLERDALSQRCYEWMHHPLGKAQWRENLDLFIAGYRLGLRGADRLSEPYWTTVADEDGTHTEGPKP